MVAESGSGDYHQLTAQIKFTTCQKTMMTSYFHGNDLLTEDSRNKSIMSDGKWAMLALQLRKA